jgi:hypothetical protein
LVVVAIAVVLLQRTAGLADRINDKAGNIASTGSGINESTRAVLKLGRTNELAGSILETAKPLEGSLNQVIGLAQRINGLAVSINGTAGAINNTANGINNTAGTILSTAESINAGVIQINRNIDTTIAVAAAIKDDTGGILGEANQADHTASCLDNGLLTSTGPHPC